MGILILLITLIIFIAKFIIFKGNSECTRKRFLIFSGTVLIIVLSIRNAEVNFGTDLNNYYRLYCRAIESQSLTDFLNTNPFEKGYLILNWLLSRIIKWPQFILFFQAIFCIGMTFRFIFKHSEDVLTSTLGFMAFGLMQFYLTGFRQSIAISICLVALEMAENRKLIKFILLIALAVSIHQTAIIFAIAYILIEMPITKVTIIIEFVAVLMLAQSVSKLITFGNDLFDKSYSGTFIGNASGGLINVFLSISVLGLLYLQLFLKKEEITNIGNKNLTKTVCKINEKYTNLKMMPLLILGTGFYVMRYQALVLERISLYFTPTLFILLPQVINTMFEKKSKKMLRMIVLVGMIFLTYWRLRKFPYLTIFNR